MTVTVRKVGGSVAVVIPKAVARDMDLVEGTRLEIDTSAQGILLHKPRRRGRRPLDEIVRQIKPASYRRHRALLSGTAVGKEPW